MKKLELNKLKIASLSRDAQFKLVGGCTGIICEDIPEAPSKWETQWVNTTCQTV